MSLFKVLSQEPDFEYVLIDATIGKAHVDASGQKGGAEAHAIGCSRGGLTTKIHAAVDAPGLPIRFVITPGQWGDRPQARGLIEGLSGVAHVRADADCDADYLRRFIKTNLAPRHKSSSTRRAQAIN